MTMPAACAALSKLGVQVVAALLMVLWGQQAVHYLGDFPPEGVVTLGWLAFAAGLQGQYELLAVILSLSAAVMGFLVFNLRHPWRGKASVFMGDAGSMALGFAIAWFVVSPLPGRGGGHQPDGLWLDSGTAGDGYPEPGGSAPAQGPEPLCRRP
jgi:hypothetical protein